MLLYQVLPCFICFLCFLMLCLHQCQSHNILVFSTVISRSHSMWSNKLAQLLASKGHQVTIVDTLPSKGKVENITKYALEAPYELYESYDYHEVSGETSPAYASSLALDYFVKSCTALLNSPTFKKFVNDHSKKVKPFDLLIHDMTCCENMLGILPLLGYPKLVAFTPFGEATNVLHIMRNHQNFIHNPFHMAPFNHPMSFVDKVKNLYYNVHYHYKYMRYIEIMDSESKEYFGSSTPHVSDLAKRSVVAFVTSHPIVDGAKYYSPAVVPVPGFQIDDPNELDEVTQSFLDGAKDGVIYFCLGSIFLGSYMSKDNIDMFLNVFKNLKQRVLWKFETFLSDVPKNVMISKWVRQNDVLAHPNVKVYISHMGLMSTLESIYHGVPMIGIPLMADQHSNLHRLSKKGVVLPLSYNELTERVLQESIKEVLTNQSYSNEMKRWSKIFKDRPVKPRDLLAYWVEFVLRNDNVEFLQPPEAYTGFLELFLFDIKTITGFFVGIVVLLVTLSAFSICKKNRKIKTQ